jgi:hypothetical protein
MNSTRLNSIKPTQAHAETARVRSHAGGFTWRPLAVQKIGKEFRSYFYVSLKLFSLPPVSFVFLNHVPTLAGGADEIKPWPLRQKA